MLPPDAEARFKKIEDDLAVTAELLRRSEKHLEDRIDQVEAIQNAMAHWLDEIAEKLNILTGAQAEMAGAQIEMWRALASLAATVDRLLQNRPNGGRPN